MMWFDLFAPMRAGGRTAFLTNLQCISAFQFFSVSKHDTVTTKGISIFLVKRKDFGDESHMSILLALCFAAVPKEDLECGLNSVIFTRKECWPGRCQMEEAVPPIHR